MSLNDLTEMTYSDQQEAYSRRQSNVNKTLSGLLNRPGLTPEHFLEAEALQRRLNSIQGGFASAWSQITSSKQQGNRGALLESSFRAMDELFSEVQLLHRRVNLGESVSEEGKELTAEDEKAFQEARDYHRSRGNLILMVLGVMLVASFAYLAFVFGLHQAVSESGEYQGVEGAVDWTRLVLAVGGRLSLLFFLAWAMKHLARLQAGHASQAVMYQDRLSGLRAADLILRRGSLEARQGVIERMAKSYLDVDSNAFRQIQSEKDAGQVSMDDAERIVKLLTTVLKSVPK